MCSELIVALVLLVTKEALQYSNGMRSARSIARANKKRANAAAKIAGQ